MWAFTIVSLLGVLSLYITLQVCKGHPKHIKRPVRAALPSDVVARALRLGDQHKTPGDLHTYVTSRPDAFRRRS